MEEGYVAYAFKNSMFIYDKKYFEFLEEEHGFVLKDHSKTFCKLELISNLNEDVDGLSSDPICFQDVIEGDKELWDVTLKWPY